MSYSPFAPSGYRRAAQRGALSDDAWKRAEADDKKWRKEKERDEKQINKNAR